MGSFVTLPIVFVTHYLRDVNEAIGGRWLVFASALLRTWIKKTTAKKRFALWDLWADKGPYNEGILPQQVEWLYENPSREGKDERIVMYGVNSKRQALTVHMTWKPSKQTIEARLVFDDGNGNTYRFAETKSGLQLDSNVYQVNGLTIKVIEPLRKLQLKFRGYLAKESANSGGQTEKVFARLSCWWVPFSQVFDYTSDTDSTLSAREICRNANSSLFSSISWEDSYEQMGQFKGTLKVEEEDEQELYLWGSRIKRRSDEDGDKKSITRVCGFSKKGHGITVNICKESANGLRHRYGCVQWGRGLIYPITYISPEFALFDSNSDTIEFSCEGGEKRFDVKGKRLRAEGGDTLFEVTINGQEGMVVVFEDDEERPTVGVSKKAELNHFTESTREMKASVVSFEEEGATIASLSGGKGASLAALLQFKRKRNQGTENCGLDFIVPKGSVVTTYGYKALLEMYKDVKEAIKELETIAWSQEKRSQLKEKSREVIEMIESRELPQQLRDPLKAKLEALFGDRVESTLFAVRSSAAGEDSEDMSAAGQMTTYLGVKGLKEIYTAVMRCWASQFNLIAVEYRRGYGQRIDDVMAVVVQEMVNCDSAGVLFTCDPISGDERKVLITANFGLGESVVSASAEPDTITLKVNVEGETKRVVGVDSIAIGSKATLIQINNNVEGGTVEVDNKERSNCCSLSDKKAIELGTIALEVSSYFGNPRDIEWGLKGDDLYLLQSRPITSLDSPSEFELMHEMDTSQPSENEYFSTANVGEVMPGSGSHFSFTFSTKVWNIPMMRRMYWLEGFKTKNFMPYIAKVVGVCCNHTFFSLKDGGFLNFKEDGEEDLFNSAMILAIFGHPVDDDNLKRDAAERTGKESAFKKLRRLVFLIPGLVFTERHLKQSEKKMIQTYNQVEDTSQRNSTQLIDSIMNSTHLHYSPFDVHLEATTSSSLYNLVILTILSSQTKDQNQILSDFAHLLSSCHDVISADVPNGLKRLAATIDDVDKFRSATDEEALEMLRLKGSKSGREFEDFISIHGHRGMKEFDPLSLPWRDNPGLIVKSVKAMVAGDLSLYREKADERSVEDILAQIKTPLTAFKRLVLRYFAVPMSRKFVGLREQTKSNLVRMGDLYRQKLWTLARKLAYEEGRIPEPELMFYMTLVELVKLTKERDPRIVAMAKLRRRTNAKTEKFKFDEIMIGPEMKPRNLKSKLIESMNDSENLRLKGIPVSAGQVVARVCVAPYLEDAEALQPGDILVTYSTDIGWSPYFPMLGGLITEIGGLVSHGAVIAREYGLPCLVGVTNVCDLLKSGDRVLLDAVKGEVVKGNNIQTCIS